MSAPTKPYTVLRAFCIAGERVEPGTVLDLPAAFAVELLNGNKVAPAVEPAVEEEPAKAPAKVSKATKAKTEEVSP